MKNSSDDNTFSLPRRETSDRRSAGASVDQVSDSETSCTLDSSYPPSTSTDTDAPRDSSLTFISTIKMDSADGESSTSCSCLENPDYSYTDAVETPTATLEKELRGEDILRSPSYSQLRNIRSAHINSSAHRNTSFSCNTSFSGSGTPRTLSDTILQSGVWHDSSTFSHSSISSGRLTGTSSAGSCNSTALGRSSSDSSLTGTSTDETSSSQRCVHPDSVLIYLHSISMQMELLLPKPAYPKILDFLRQRISSTKEPVVGVEHSFQWVCEFCGRKFEVMPTFGQQPGVDSKLQFCCDRFREFVQNVTGQITAMEKEAARKGLRNSFSLSESNSSDKKWSETQLRKDEELSMTSLKQIMKLGKTLEGKRSQRSHYKDKREGQKRKERSKLGERTKRSDDRKMRKDTLSELDRRHKEQMEENKQMQKETESDTLIGKKKPDKVPYTIFGLSVKQSGKEPDETRRRKQTAPDFLVSHEQEEFDKGRPISAIYRKSKQEEISPFLLDRKGTYLQDLDRCRSDIHSSLLDIQKLAYTKSPAHNEITFRRSTDSERSQSVVLGKAWWAARRRSIKSGPVAKIYDAGISCVSILPNGTGNVYYLSGNVAIVIYGPSKDQLSYVVLEDKDTNPQLLACLNSSGVGFCYFPDGLTRLMYGHIGGSVLQRDGLVKQHWTWQVGTWCDNFHPVCFGLNPQIGVRVMGRKCMFLSFRDRQHFCKFPVGAQDDLAHRVKTSEPHEESSDGSDRYMEYLRETRPNLRKLLNDFRSLVQSLESKRSSGFLPNVFQYRFLRGARKINASQRQSWLSPLHNVGV